MKETEKDVIEIMKKYVLGLLAAGNGGYRCRARWSVWGDTDDVK